MKQALIQIFEQAIETKAKALRDAAFTESVLNVASAMCSVIKAGGTIYACGNGGSTCDAMHLCEELVARFKRERPGIRAMHFMDPSILTCWSNDYDFQSAFERQAQTFCTPKDLLCGFSTSGNSKNVLAAIKAAKAQGSVTVGFTGQTGGALAGAAAHLVKVPSQATERIQESHITVVHALIELVEQQLFPSS